MQNIILTAFAATVCTWLMTALGAATVGIFRNRNRRAMNAMLGFAAGVMVAASFWSLLEPAIESAERYLTAPSWLVAVSGFLLGAGFMWLCDRIVRRMGKNTLAEAAAQKTQGLSRAGLLVISITLHNIPEGMAVGVAFGAIGQSANPHEALMAAISVAVGIGIQNFPEGAAVSVPLRREGLSAKKSFLIGQATALVEPVAGVLGAALVMHIQTMLPYALAFAAGAMILVAVHELIPQAQEERAEGGFLSTMGIVCGFATMMLLDVALG